MDYFMIVEATADDAEEILKLYKANLYGAADWDENYPNETTIEFDLSRNALYVMKNENDEIIATISIDEDDEVEALGCWSKELKPAGEISRLCIRDDVKNKGLARIMIQHTMNILKQRGFKGIHYLVRVGHEVAMKSYAHLGFEQVGECHLFEKDFICFERTL